MGNVEKLFIETCQSFLRISLAITTPLDILELFIIACLLYFFMRWLSYDSNKHVLISWLGYNLLVFTCYHIQLYTLSSILFFSLPIVTVLLIIAHQDTLQKNCIAYKVVKPLGSAKALEWIDILMRTCMTNAHKQQSITCIIERFDSLESSLETTYLLNADMCSEVLELHTKYQQDAFLLNNQENLPLVWIHHSGIIRSVNTFFNSIPESIWLYKATHYLPNWKKHALVLTNRTDALVVHLSPQTRLFECIVAGTSIENLSAGATLLLIKEYLIKQTIRGNVQTGENIYKQNTLNNNHEVQI